MKAHAHLQTCGQKIPAPVFQPAGCGPPLAPADPAMHASQRRCKLSMVALGVVQRWRYATASRIP